MSDPAGEYFAAERAKQLPPAVSLDPDEALAGVPDIFEPCPTDEEEARRWHVGEFVLRAVDPTLTKEQRLDAVRHILGCDPVRGISCLIELTTSAQRAIEESLGDPPGTAVRLIREDLRSRLLDEALDLLGSDE